MDAENNQIGFWEWNLISNAMFNDITYTQLLGYDQAEFNCNFKLWKENIHKDDIDGVFELIYAHLEGLTPYYESFYRSKNKAGDWVWILDKGSISEWDANGIPVRMIGTHQNHCFKNKSMSNMTDIFNITDESRIVNISHKDVARNSINLLLDLFDGKNQMETSISIDDISEKDKMLVKKSLLKLLDREK